MMPAPFAYGLALLRWLTAGVTVFVFVPMGLKIVGYTMAISTSLPCLHLGQSVMSVPYFSSSRTATGMFIFGGSGGNFNCFLAAFSLTVLPWFCKKP